jgi:uncharacterized membrane protein
MDSPEKTTQRLTRALSLVGVALGVPQVALPLAAARAGGVDDLKQASGVIRAMGARDIALGLALLVGPPRTIWARVACDAVDLALMGSLLPGREGQRRRRLAVATVAIGALSAVDVYAAVRASRRRQHGQGRPGPLELDATTIVSKDPQAVYAFWRDFENLPTFMRHLQSVTDTGDGLSRWVANAPLKRSVSWEAEMTGDEPGRRISWRSLPGADIDNSGTVHFAATPDGTGTEVRVVLHYDVPGGPLGRGVARLLGEEPEQQVRDDLSRFKQVLESGATTSAG